MNSHCRWPTCVPGGFICLLSAFQLYCLHVVYQFAGSSQACGYTRKLGISLRDAGKLVNSDGATETVGLSRRVEKTVSSRGPCHERACRLLLTPSNRLFE
ncbi:hypothetical protein LX32DRAFT_374307 [Colletotrichum zoysiae]|uniref:Uncharacterized protein n=1 Tax=Colletotrichum zoysiae TaxID=1216348 RepID=A0AAD9HT96_9PEZI|nr:hypothetical protein LX32DRAFT_374307 [Colletotrichum zoysiae]